MSKATLEEKALACCEGARAQLMLRHPFVGRLGIQIQFVPVEDCRIHTLATNGKVIYFRPDWVCSQPPVTLAAAVGHTIWTAALCHSFRRGEYDTMRFDIASDIEVYNLLLAEKVTMARKPDFADLLPDYMPVEEILKVLPEVTCVRSADTDVHLYTAGVVSIPPLPGRTETEKKKEENKSGDRETASEPGENGAGGQKNPASEPSAPDNADDGEGIREADCTCDPAMREVWRQRIIEAEQHYRMTYGVLPGALQQLVSSFRKGQIDYKQLLRRYLGQCSGGEAHWLPPARRFVWQGQYLPSRTEPLLEIVVAVDTSGSIDVQQFQKFFGEVHALTKNFNNWQLTLLECDTCIQYTETFSTARPFDPQKPVEIHGGGGTSFTPVFDYLREKKITPRVLLYYTDGDGKFPPKAPAYPVIWILTGDVSVPWGRKIVIPNMPDAAQ